MIEFSLSEEQRALQEMAHGFALKEMRPNAARYDKGDAFPEEVMRKAFEAGFMTCNIPETHGGGGLSNFDMALISEELSAGCAGMFTSIMAVSLATTPIVLFGSEEQKRKFLWQVGAV